MSPNELLECKVVALARQVALLRDELAEMRRTGGGDRLVLIEFCRIRGWTLAEALGPNRPAAVRALRDSLSAARVARIFGLSARHVRRLCAVSTMAAECPTFEQMSMEGTRVGE